MKISIKDPLVLLIAVSIFFIITGFVGDILQALIMLTTSVTIVSKNGAKSMSRKSFRFLSFFLIVAFVYAIFGLGTLSGDLFKSHIFSFIFIFYAFFVSYQIRYLRSSQIKFLLGVSLVSILISVIATTYVSFINPLALREFGFGELVGSEVQEAAQYQSMGMMSYIAAHSMSVVVTGLSVVPCYYKNKWMRILSVVLLFLIIRLLFVMTITTALLLAVLGMAIVITYYLSRGNIIMGMILGLSLFFVLFFTGFSAFFLDFSESSNKEIFAKLEEVFSVVQTGSETTQLGYREDLFSVSFKTFLSNPIFGMGSDNGSRKVIGEHSFFLDYLAYYGLFALVFFYSYWKEYSSLKDRLGKLRKLYLYSVIPVVGLFLLKAEIVCLNLFFMSLVFIPLIYLNAVNSIDNMVSTD